MKMAIWLDKKILQADIESKTIQPLQKSQRQYFFFSCPIVENAWLTFGSLDSNLYLNAA